MRKITCFISLDKLESIATKGPKSQPTYLQFLELDSKELDKQERKEQIELRKIVDEYMANEELDHIRYKLNAKLQEFTYPKIVPHFHTDTKKASYFFHWKEASIPEKSIDETLKYSPEDSARIMQVNLETDSRIGDCYLELMADIVQGQEIKVCPNCNRIFRPTHRNQKYCTRKTKLTCQQAAAQKAYRESLQDDPVKLEKRRKYLREKKREERQKK